jgi:acyl-CoA hydrolase
MSVVYKRFVMFKDLNPAANLYGGIMMKWIDEAAAIFGTELLGRFDTRIVTLKVSEVLFRHPAAIGNLLTFHASLAKVGRTSFDVRISVQCLKKEIVTCDVTFVNINIATGVPTPHDIALLTTSLE